jgi:hypothetical protein
MFCVTVVAKCPKDLTSRWVHVGFRQVSAMVHFEERLLQSRTEGWEPYYIDYRCVDLLFLFKLLCMGSDKRVPPTLCFHQAPQACIDHVVDGVAFVH